MRIKVCDAMCGAGKTQAAIHMMNANAGGRYLFITPRLSEARRIQKGCPGLDFAEPVVYDRTGKFGSLITLLQAGKNIASTHSLFRRYDEQIAELIRSGEYTLVLDEVVEVVEILDIRTVDVRLAIEWGIIAIDEDDRVLWIDDKYDGWFARYKPLILNGNVFIDGHDKLLLWLFPKEVLEAFREVYLLTYMFEAQVQRYYFDMTGMEYEYIGVRHIAGLEYEFCRQDGSNFKIDLQEKVHILDDEKANEIGERKTALSVSWFDTDMRFAEHPCISRLRLNLQNVLRNKFGARSKDIIWTTFKDYRARVSSKGYTRSFLPFNSRAINDYSDRHYLAYCANVYMHPTIKIYFTNKGVLVREDEYALSELIQWVWRSAIRKGEEIWVYIPSKRMRDLFSAWIEKVSKRA